MCYFVKHSLDGQFQTGTTFKLDNYMQTATGENSLIITQDNKLACVGYCIDGNNVTQVLFLKYDTSGHVLLSKAYTAQNSQRFFGRRLIETENGFFIQGTIQYPNFDVGLFVMKIDSSGNERWRRYYGSNSTDEMAAAFIKTNGNRLLIAGQKNNRKYSDYHLFKSWSYLLLLDTAGTIVRDTIGEDENMGIPQSLIETQDGNFVYCTNYYVSKYQWMGYYTKGYIAKIDSNLNLMWERMYEDSSPITGLKSVIEMPGGNLVTVGTTYTDTIPIYYYHHNNGLVLKLDENGNQIWRKEYRGVTRIGQQLEDNVLHDCEVLSDGSIIACGVAQDNNDTFPQQAWLLRINADGCMDDGFCGYTGVDEVKNETREQTILKVYPNPAKNSVTIQYVDVQEKSNLVITNIFGTQVDMLPLTEGNGKLILNTGSYVSGMYLISVESLGRIAAKYKLVVQK